MADISLYDAGSIQSVDCRKRISSVYPSYLSPLHIPVITDVSPAGGASVSSTDVVSFKIQGKLAFISIDIEFASGMREIVYDTNRGFLDPYSSSTLSDTGDGFVFYLQRTGGWPEGFIINPRAVDVRGQVNS